MMPFKKLGGGQYEGPSGKKFNLAQVRLYYANDGFPGQKKAGGGPVMNAPYKGAGPVSAKFAEGGNVLQATKSRFAKNNLNTTTPDVFRTDIERNDYDKKSPGGEMSKTSGDSKSERPIKPRR